MYLHFFRWITMHHLTRWKANILSQAWETHPINVAFFHPLVSLTVVTAHQKEQLAQNTICQLGGRWGQLIHDSLSSVSIYSEFLGVERGPSAILGHRNVLYSAICSSNCRVRGIFYISCIEAQQLQLPWHAVGVFKGGVAAKRVSENNLPPRATHTCTPTHKTYRGYIHRDPHVTITQIAFCCVKINNVHDMLKHRGKYCALKVAPCSAATRHPWSHCFRGESVSFEKTLHTHVPILQLVAHHLQLNIYVLNLP